MQSREKIWVKNIYPVGIYPLIYSDLMMGKVVLLYEEIIVVVSDIL